MALHAEGGGTVTAGDINAPPEIDLLNPDLPLITVDDEDAVIDVDFTVEQGWGYRPAEDGSEGGIIGEMPIDAVFSPIRRVSYEVDRARVGQVTNYDRLTLEVWSDGRMEPFDAIKEAARILLKHLRLIAGLTLEEEREAVEEEEVEEGLPSEVYEMSLDQLGLSTRVFNALRRAGVKNVGEVLEMVDEGGEDALLAVRNVGSKSLDEIREALDEADLLGEIGGL